MNSFEVRLATDPNGWRTIIARGPAEAAEAFVHGFEHSTQAWSIAERRRTALVVVRDAGKMAVASYRVTGQLVPRYTAALELPGAAEPSPPPLPTDFQAALASTRGKEG